MNKLSEILIKEGLLSKDEVSLVKSKLAKNESFKDSLIRLNLMTEDKVLKVLEQVLGYERTTLAKVSSSLYFNKDYCLNNLVLVFEKSDVIKVAINDPLNYYLMDEIRFKLKEEVVFYTALKNDLINAIERSYSLAKVLDFVNEESESIKIEENDSPMIKLVDHLIEDAINSNASDIHIDPGEELIIRYRIDSILYQTYNFSMALHSKIVSRIKVMAKLDITETRLPQDGRISFSNGEDLRVSILPTVYGEKIVLRLLKQSKVKDSLRSLGLSKYHEKELLKVIHAPNGIFLVSGPTGSGKSTVLYTMLNLLNDTKKNIITIEDPVEMKIKGVNQVSVREDLGLDFASSLRAILRQDPDVIMIGEIRDEVTARIAVRASLTGHLVFSSIHTNSASDTVIRLVDMGIESYLVSDALIGVLASRLVRRVCPHCSELVSLNSYEQELFDKYGIKVEKIRKAKGCSKCGMRGYNGRIGIFELIMMDKKIANLISKGSDFKNELNQTPILIDGLIKVSKGITTLEEVLSVVSEG